MISVRTDADWAGSESTARSRSGAYITMLGGPVYWKSQFQKVIALSSTHSEVIALSDMCKRLVWILSLLQYDFESKEQKPKKLRTTFVLNFPCFIRNTDG